MKAAYGWPRQDPGLSGLGALPARLGGIVREAEQDRTRWDPKEGELCQSTTKTHETQKEELSGTDEQ
ncbi:hypothetical protein AAHH80_40085, partial [Burkholderia pseudomallei]